MSAPTRGRGPSSGREAWIFPGVGAGVLALAGGTWGVLRAADALGGTTHVAGMNPIEAGIGLATGDVPWTGWATTVAVLVLAVLLGFGALILRARRRRAKAQPRSRVDVAARHMGKGQDIATLTLSHARQVAQRFGIQGESFGLPIGDTVAGGTRITSTWEDVLVIIAGPRTQKSTCYAIPHVLAAPGPVVATSNKRDVVDATRDLRAAHAPHAQVWVFDPQQIANETPTWWWNPLSYVTDEDKAAKLAGIFATAERDAGAKTDAYFEPAGRRLLASMLLAAATGNLPITELYTWLNDPRDVTPATLLADAGYPLHAKQLRGAMSTPDKQRAGVYGTALEMVGFLTSRAAMRWVTPDGPMDRRPQFSPAAFVRTADALYPLSKEGGGSAAPLLTALTAAVTEAAEEYATTQPHGRLAKPMVMVLDEAANICRWAELPNLYSHFGSRGISVVTILQSWAQGEAVWGDKGMNKLWSSANVRVYGGGVDDTKFLEDRSRIIGEYEYEDRSVSSSKHGSSTSRSMRRERILSPDDLAALPKGRAIVFAGSGARPTMVRTLRWMDGPDAAAINASIAQHNPNPGQALAEHAREHAELAAVDSAAA